MVEGVARSGDSRFRNGTLGDANSGYASVAEFWALVFVVSHGASDSAGYNVTDEESVAGVMITSRGRGAAFAEASTGSSITNFLGTVYFPSR